MAKFLRRKQGGWCRDCYYADKECPDDACVEGGFSYIADTIIPQKLALYEESLKVLIDVGDDLCNICGLPCGDKRCEYYQKIKSIIDRAKKIQEEE